MAERKNVTIGFYKLGLNQETYTINPDASLSILAEQPSPHGFFDGKTQELMFRVHEPIKSNHRTLHIVSIVKEKTFLPVRFDREGNVTAAVENPDMLGDIAYGLVDVNNQALLTLGGNSGMFGDFLRYLTGDSALSISPILIGNLVNQVAQWEIFRKVTLGVEAPSMDFLTQVMDSDAGQYCTLLETLRGLKIEITVSMGHSRGSLHKDAVKSFIKAVLSDNFAGKLKLSGKCFDEQATAEIDLYNARLKHKTKIVIAGSHISPDEARSSLYEAYQLHLDDIEANVEGDGDE